MQDAGCISCLVSIVRGNPKKNMKPTRMKTTPWSMLNPGNFCQAFTLQKASGSRIIAAPAMSRRDQQETPPPNISQNPPDLTSFKKKTAWPSKESTLCTNMRKGFARTKRSTKMILSMFSKVFRQIPGHLHRYFSSIMMGWAFVDFKTLEQWKDLSMAIPN